MPVPVHLYATNGVDLSRLAWYICRHADKPSGYAFLHPRDLQARLTLPKRDVWALTAAKGVSTGSGPSMFDMEDDFSRGNWTR